MNFYKLSLFVILLCISFIITVHLNRELVQNLNGPKQFAPLMVRYSWFKERGWFINQLKKSEKSEKKLEIFQKKDKGLRKIFVHKNSKFNIIHSP